MSSGLVQLVAVGAQDEHIIGEPEISFFTSTFKRHSNFSQSVEKQTIQGAVKGNSMSSIRLERKRRIYLDTRILPLIIIRRPSIFRIGVE